jgi:hypothetical protein
MYLMTPVCPSPDIQSRVRRHCRLEIDQSLIVLEQKRPDVQAENIGEHHF